MFQLLVLLIRQCDSGDTHDKTENPIGVMQR